jgi:hypothetical protein
MNRGNIMKVFKSRTGSLAVKYNGTIIHTNLGGSYVDPRFILEDMPNPIDADNWEVYPDANLSLVGSEARVENGKLIVSAYNREIYFSPQDSRYPFDCGGSYVFASIDAEKIAVERTPHCYAVFYDLSGRYGAQVDHSKTIY